MERLPSSLFIRASLEWLKKTGDEALLKLAEGSMTINISFSGKTLGKQVFADPRQILDAVNNELRRRDPANYGYRDTRTSASFGS
jgi:hypothetical protein